MHVIKQPARPALLTMNITYISDTHGLHHELDLPGGDLLIHAEDGCDLVKPGISSIF